MLWTGGPAVISEGALPQTWVVSCGECGTGARSHPWKPRLLAVSDPMISSVQLHPGPMSAGQGGYCHPQNERSGSTVQR